MNRIVEQIERLVEQVGRHRGALIAVLAAVQSRYGYLSEEALAAVSRAMRIPESEVYGVATFYARFRFAPPGQHTMKVCLGTACHVRGGAKILAAIESKFKVRPGGTTKDKKLSLERATCHGSCALGPIVVLDGKIHAKMTPARTEALLRQVVWPKEGQAD